MMALQCSINLSYLLTKILVNKAHFSIPDDGIYPKNLKILSKYCPIIGLLKLRKSC
ncbi:hypothetical protein EJK53_1142 [Moraxella catarrhalis]|uniref:Uncharacterized protein n=1 Tax=Moraxella catarrhalis TaxID=480 RepID=A0A3Q9GFM5_MORCA|nr:hypothetical protein MCR_1016 [Moraxella catarrhalis BBH18]AZQ93056.1 hypothetical protein EJK53_1142 [Moraxella catarrhalis]